MARYHFDNRLRELSQVSAQRDEVAVALLDGKKLLADVRTRRPFWLGSAAMAIQRHQVSEFPAAGQVSSNGSTSGRLSSMITEIIFTLCTGWVRFAWRILSASIARI